MSTQIRQQVSSITLMVHGYDEAIKFYTEKLGFKLIENIDLGQGERWVLISPANSQGVTLCLTKANTKQEKLAVGNQAGGRVLLILKTNDFWRDYNYMKAQGVEFNEEPREEEYGTVVVFKDLYGTLWDLIQSS